MNKVLGFFFLFLSLQLTAQILPKENAVLNYRLIGFSFPEIQNAKNYKIEIAAGNYNNEDSFNKNIIANIESKNNKIIAEVPSFGGSYSWRTVAAGRLDAAVKSDLYHFSVGSIQEVDTNANRLRIVENTGKYHDAYVFLDAGKLLYDMSGHPVWYLPEIEGQTLQIRDIKLTKRGTITFLSSDAAYEINYNGDILWKTPNNGIVSGDTLEHYHHVFTRLDNGNYMVLGSEYVNWSRNPSPSGDNIVNNKAENKFDTVDNIKKRKIQFGTIIEYNEKGNVVWSWKSSGYFMKSDLIDYKPPAVRQSTDAHEKIVDVHENAFFFDEKNSVVYLGFRNIGRILKVKYPDGYVMNAYGEIFTHGAIQRSNNLFCGQHALSISQKGYLYVFNNNNCNNEGPKITMMQEFPNSDSLKKVWEYQCPLDNMAAPVPAPGKIPFTAGGNVVELPDQSIFASMSAPYNKVFIVNPDKEILWSAFSEKLDPVKNKWQSNPQYRASIIKNRKEMESLIWFSAVKK